MSAENLLARGFTTAQAREELAQTEFSGAVAAELVRAEYERTMANTKLAEHNRRRDQNAEPAMSMGLEPQLPLGWKSLLQMRAREQARLDRIDALNAEFKARGHQGRYR